MSQKPDAPGRARCAHVLVTGANGHLGLQLLAHWLAREPRNGPPPEITAAAARCASRSSIRSTRPR
jgi:hypothetical protein